MLKFNLSILFFFAISSFFFTQEIIKVDFDADLNLIIEGDKENVVTFTSNTEASSEGTDLYKWAISGGEEGKSWKFANNSLASNESISVEFISIGNYSVSLSVKNKATKGKGKMKKKNLISVVGKYPKLVQLFVSDDLKKLVKTAEKYTLNEKLKSDPIPLAWLSRGLYKISATDDDDPAFANAFNDSYGALTKAVKADVNGALQEDPELGNFVDNYKKEYVEKNIDKYYEILKTTFELQDDLEILTNPDDIKETKESIKSEKKQFDKSLSKLNGFAKKYLKITDKKMGPKLLQMATFYSLKNSSAANEIWKTLEEEISNISTDVEYSEADLLMLEYGSIALCRYFKSSKQIENACLVLKKAQEIFSNDEDDHENFFDFYANKFNSCK